MFINIYILLSARAHAIFFLHFISAYCLQSSKRVYAVYLYVNNKLTFRKICLWIDDHKYDVYIV